MSPFPGLLQIIRICDAILLHERAECQVLRYHE